MQRLIFLITICFLSLVNMNAQESAIIKITVGTSSYVATLSDNATAWAFASLLPMTITMKELNGNEKFHNLSGNLPASPERQSTIHAGDLMLYGQNCIVLFYESFTTSYSYTKIGSIDNPVRLKTALGSNNPIVTFELTGSTIRFENTKRQ